MSRCVYRACFCFFFQAEDGIRDLIVTGVQTCALPISSSDESPARPVAQAKESWWRRVLPGSGKKTPRTVDGVALAPAASAPAPMPTDRKDISGVWRGRWAANGSRGERRASGAQENFAPTRPEGAGRPVPSDAVA